MIYFSWGITQQILKQKGRRVGRSNKKIFKSIENFLANNFILKIKKKTSKKTKYNLSKKRKKI